MGLIYMDWDWPAADFCSLRLAQPVRLAGHCLPLTDCRLWLAECRLRSTEL